MAHDRRNVPQHARAQDTHAHLRVFDELQQRRAHAPAATEDQDAVPLLHTGGLDGVEGGHGAVGQHSRLRRVNAVRRLPGVLDLDQGVLGEAARRRHPVRRDDAISDLVVCVVCRAWMRVHAGTDVFIRVRSGSFGFVCSVGFMLGASR